MTTFSTATATNGEIGPLTQTVYDFCAAQGQVLAAGVTRPEDWEPMSRYLSPDFKRVGAYLEELNYADYCDFLTGWAAGCEWEGSFKRITEAPNLVILELEERVRFGDFTSAVNSISVYEFNASGKLVHLDIYLQMALPDPASLESYEGIQITE